MTEQWLAEVAKLNHFDIQFKEPTIWVFRNTVPTPKGYLYVKDRGNNITDTVFLSFGKEVRTLLGRSLPHRKYIRGGANYNYIAPSYNRYCWKPGNHLPSRGGGYPALRQCGKFVIWRSGNSILFDEDDYDQYDIVWDNFHGWAPSSAGCCTVRGRMYKRGGGTRDWRIAHNWIYGTCRNFRRFSNVILNHWDIFGKNERMRVGSNGEPVTRLQTNLAKYGIKIGIDGDFGVCTHNALQSFQAARGLGDDGIYGPKTGKALVDCIGSASNEGFF